MSTPSSAPSTPAQLVAAPLALGTLWLAATSAPARPHLESAGVRTGLKL